MRNATQSFTRTTSTIILEEVKRGRDEERKRGREEKRRRRRRRKRKMKVSN